MYLCVSGIRDTTKWSEKMRKPMENIYGQEYFAKMVSVWVDTLLDIGKTNGGDICKSSLSNIIAPTLVLQGDKDPVVPIEHAEYLAKNIPNSVLHVYKGGNHVIHLRYPEEFNKIVDEFLSI
uniref:AB hydrolase-1 domain-containing protein n=1 Tax=Clastoptera arizonana TaxID=38151 RepID=A0A1B6CBH7_9HEMI